MRVGPGTILKSKTNLFLNEFSQPFLNINIDFLIKSFNIIEEVNHMDDKVLGLLKKEWDRMRRKDLENMKMILSSHSI